MILCDEITGLTVNTLPLHNGVSNRVAQAVMVLHSSGGGGDDARTIVAFCVCKCAYVTVSDTDVSASVRKVVHLDVGRLEGAGEQVAVGGVVGTGGDELEGGGRGVRKPRGEAAWRAGTYNDNASVMGLFPFGCF